LLGSLPGLADMIKEHFCGHQEHRWKDRHHYQALEVLGAILHLSSGRWSSFVQTDSCFAGTIRLGTDWL